MRNPIGARTAFARASRSMSTPLVWVDAFTDVRVPRESRRGLRARRAADPDGCIVAFRDEHLRDRVRGRPRRRRLRPALFTPTREFELCGHATLAQRMCWFSSDAAVTGVAFHTQVGRAECTRTATGRDGLSRGGPRCRAPRLRLAGCPRAHRGGRGLRVRQPVAGRRDHVRPPRCTDCSPTSPASPTSAAARSL